MRVTSAHRPLTGWIGEPLTRGERLKKFHSCARRVLDPSAAESVVALVEKLDALSGVTAIMDIVRTPAGKDRT